MVFSYSGFLVENKIVNGHSYRLVKRLVLNTVYLVLNMVYLVLNKVHLVLNMVYLVLYP